MLALPPTTAPGAPACCRHQLPRLLAPILLLLLAGCLRNDPPGLYLADTSPPDSGQPGDGAEGEGAEGEGEGEGAEGEGAEGEGAEGEGTEGEGTEGEGEGAEGEGAEGEGTEGEGDEGEGTEGEGAEGEGAEGEGAEGEGEGEGATVVCSGQEVTPPCNGCPVGTIVPDDWVCVPAGIFTMGSPEGETGRFGDETPHEATITRPFLMQVTEVTQGQWAARMGTTPSFFAACGDDCPVEQVSWYEAVTYCNALSTAEGLAVCYTDPADGTAYVLADASASKVPEWAGPGCQGYRLPTEAEWEYAARAGTETALYNGADVGWEILGVNNAPALDPIAWYGGNSGVDYAGGWDCSTWPEKQCPSLLCGTQRVGLKLPNPWGLHDAIGNIMEWCWDWKAAYPEDSTDDYIGPSEGEYRISRGGFWSGEARDSRSAPRFAAVPGSRNYLRGFRPVRSLP